MPITCSPDTRPIPAPYSADPPRRSPLRRADGRTRAAKRLRVLEAALAADLPQPVTPATLARVGLAASLVVRLELLQASLARGEHVDDESLVRLGNTLSRTLADLGLSDPPRVPTNTVPSLQEYLASRDPAPTEATG